MLRPLGVTAIVGSRSLFQARVQLKNPPANALVVIERGKQNKV